MHNLQIVDLLIYPVHVNNETKLRNGGSEVNTGATPTPTKLNPHHERFAERILLRQTALRALLRLLSRKGSCVDAQVCQ